MITICCLLIFLGRVSDSKGKIKIFRIGTFIFVFGSLLCGISSSIEMILISRIVQSVGASMTMATNYETITQYFPKKSHKTESLNIDYTGFILFDISIISLFMAIFISQVTGFKSILVISLLILFIVTMIAFIYVENKITSPLIDITIFNSKAFSFGLLCTLLVFSSNLFLNTLIPFYLQNTIKLSSLLSGFILMTVPIVMVVVAPISGNLSDKISSEGLTFVGLGIVCITQILFIFINKATSLQYLITLTTLTGIDVALFQSPNNSIIMSYVEPIHLGIAGSINSLARNLGMVIGLSLSTTILYFGMSNKDGYKVPGYISGQSELFLSGMHIAFAVSFVLCVIAFNIVSVLEIKRIQ